MKRILFSGFIIVVIVVIILCILYGKYAQVPSDSLVTLDDNSSNQAVLTVPDIVPTLTIDSVPESVKVGEIFNVSWSIKTPNLTPFVKAGLFYGNKPSEGSIEKFVNAGKLYQGVVPDVFVDKIKATDKGTLYIRAMISLNGKQYLSDEKQISVVAK